MTAVVLEQFQQSFLEYLGGVLSLTIGKITETDAILRKQFIIKEYKQIVDIFVSKFDEKHFSKPWVIKSLNHKDGKDLLADYFDKVFKGKPVQKHRLIHGS
jgi:predicted SnoaL-like aldol condensation-catalyzing enzyme